MEIKKEVISETTCESYSDTFPLNVNGEHVFQPNVIAKIEESEVTTASSTLSGSTTKWSPLRWQDETRKSAFQPYKPSKCTVLTNLQRGNTQAETPVPQETDVNFHTRAGQGEIGVQDINNESSVDIADDNGLTALHWAASYGQMMSVSLLLKHGAEINFLGPDGESALLLAAAGGHHEVVRILLGEGAEVNHTDHVGNTALMYAAHGDHPHSCNELLLHGADVTISNHVGESAFTLAVNNKSRLAQSVIENYLLTLLSSN